MPNPFKAVMNIRRDELPLSLLMFGYFFLVISSFWILKPLKTALFLQYYQVSGVTLGAIHLGAAQAELLAKVLNMGVAFIAVIVFTWLSRRLYRQKLTFVFTAFFLVSYLVYSFVLQNPSAPGVWTFYLFGDLFSTLMVATFFSFMNDSVTPEMAKRMYGLVGLGGVVGGVFGTSVLRVWIEDVSIQGWMFVNIGTGLLILLIAYAAGRIVDRGKLSNAVPDERIADTKSNGSTKNAAIEGASLVFRSPYLLSIVAIVGLYEIVSTILDFQFKATIVHYLSGADLGTHLSTVYTITNWISMFVQFFLTSFIMTRFGLTAALAVLPVAVLLASAGFAAFPVLLMGSFLNTADNGFSYSINQSAKETLYVPTSREEKYKAKAFIDMFVQRFAKAIAVGISLLITMLFNDFSSLRYLSLVTVVIIVIWFVAVRYAGRRFSDLSNSTGGNGK
ncbi:hypothetical protein KQI63_01910 [bacterium]|nr:hypothetical protein [bacterium]